MARRSRNPAVVPPAPTAIPATPTPLVSSRRLEMVGAGADGVEVDMAASVRPAAKPGIGDRCEVPVNLDARRRGYAGPPAW
jgi:hypothetical protein